MNKQENIEQIAPGVVREEYGDIIIYTVTNPSRESIDAWIETMSQRIQSAPRERYFTMYDTSHPTMGLTPYMRKRFQEFSHQRANIVGCTAIVMQTTVVARIARLFVEREMRRRYPRQDIRIFFKRDEALAWLESEVAAYRGSTTPPTD